MKILSKLYSIFKDYNNKESKVGLFTDKTILVSGGAGMIGRELINLLKKYSPKSIINVSLDNDCNIDNVIHYKLDLRYLNKCVELFYKTDPNYVFHLAGIKGSPQMAMEKPASFSVPMMMFNLNMMECARQFKVQHYLYTSSIGVYHPAEILKEDDVWKTFPSSNDRFAGWAKRMGELQAEAYNIEYKVNNISIVRPANVYGTYDNFSESGMVIPNLIRRICNGENPLKVWGNGEPIRDFIHARDVARGMIFAVENNITEPINLGSGTGIPIKDLVTIIIDIYKEITGNHTSVLYQPDKPTGDLVRLMDMTRANNYGFKSQISLRDGIKETMLWYLDNKDNLINRFDGFK